MGHKELELEVEEQTTVEDLLQRLVSDYPKLAGHTGTLMVAVNAEYVEAAQRLHAGDEVALIPPVSGGSYV